MARQRLDPRLAAKLVFDGVGILIPKKKRRQGGGRRHRLRRFAGEQSRTGSWVLRGVSSRIEAGESVAVLGLKNSGRTELLRLAAGTLIPDEGSVMRSDQVLPMIGLGRAFDRGFTVRQNIYLLGGLLGMNPNEVEVALPEIVETAGITSNIDKYLGGASALTRQKLAWTIAMATGANIFAVDEMLVVGDPEFRARCFAHVQHLKTSGATFLVATDVPRKFDGFFDRAIVLHDGGVVADGAFADGLALLRELRLANTATDPTEPKTDPEARPEPEEGF
ncbi:MAG: ATP-binding cassette domain-containing protein [Candidatus Nanopelagicales bacterium]|nr:ATP-binding cassette domain-containing protein [Candidatus Nanopelagicales bacterium]